MDTEEHPIDPASFELEGEAPDAEPADVELGEQAPPPERQPLLIEAPLQIKERGIAEVSPDPRLWLMTEPGSAMAEQYRVLSLKLREGQSLRAVALMAPTGATDGGLAASNVALAISEGTRTRVLLIDANLRTPTLADLFGLPRGWTGLAEQVRRHQRDPGDEWSALTLSSTLCLLPSGPAPERNPSAVLSAEPIAELFAEARRAYDYIVVSPPPVLESADVNILQDQLDGAVLVVRAGKTRRDSVAASIKRLHARTFVGAMLVGVRPR
jgi:Mrp family chromosome partitioning ATPase